MKSTLSFYRSVFLRRIHYFLLIAILVGSASITLARILPAVYVAQTSLLVEPPKLPGGVAASGPVEELQLIEEGLMTRVNLLSIAREIQVLPNIETLDADDIVSAMNSGTKIKFSTGRGQATIFRLSFGASTGAHAANVVNRYVTIILENDVARRTGVAGENLNFYEGEVEKLNQKLAVRNSALLLFNSENSDALPNSLVYRLSQQSLLQERLNSIAAQIRAYDEEKGRLVAVFNATGQVGAGNIVNQSPEQKQLAQLQDSLRAALAVYSVEHPKVKLIEAQVKQQEIVVSQQLSAGAGTTNGASSILDINLADIDGRIDLLTGEVARIEGQLLVLSDSIERTPANTIRLGELQREQSSIQKQYDSAVNKLSQAAAAERIELLSKGQRISVLNPPTIPSRPSSPNRILIAVGGSALGVFMGLGVIVLLELLNSSIRRPTDITRSLGITPIVSVPYIRTPLEQVARRGLIFAAFALVVFGVPAVLYGIHNYYMPLDLIYDSLAGKLSNIIGIG